MRTLILALIVSCIATPVLAQYDQLDEPRGYVDLGLELGNATGEFKSYVDNGFGFRADLRWQPGPLGLRFSGNYLLYGSSTSRYPLLPGIAVDVTTRNQIIGFGVGPHLSLGAGGFRPYAFGTLGFSYFVTNSSAEGSGNPGQTFASSNNYDDFTFAADGGAGLMLRVANGRTPVFLDMGARYLDNGRVTYVTKNGLTVSGNTLFVSPVTSGANLTIYFVGVSIGLRDGNNRTGN